MTLVESLTAQVNKDDQYADAARGLLGIETAWHTAAQLQARGLTRADADHIARHDPARVMREVETKRRIVAMYEDAVRRVRNPPSAEARQAARVEQLVMEEVLRALALPHADHPDYPDYREE